MPTVGQLLGTQPDPPLPNRFFTGVIAASGQVTLDEGGSIVRPTLRIGSMPATGSRVLLLTCSAGTVLLGRLDVA